MNPHSILTRSCEWGQRSSVVVARITILWYRKFHCNPSLFQRVNYEKNEGGSSPTYAHQWWFKNRTTAREPKTTITCARYETHKWTWRTTGYQFKISDLLFARSSDYSHVIAVHRYLFIHNTFRKLALLTDIHFRFVLVASVFHDHSRIISVWTSYVLSLWRHMIVVKH